MAMRIERVTGDFGDYDLLAALYTRAFPENERRPLEPLVSDSTGHGEVMAFYDGAVFCGFACLITWRDISHIIYFAIDEKLRGRGYGAQALELMRGVKNDCRMIADLEVVREGASNNIPRERRLAFYMRNGYAESPVRYTWRGDDYVILVQGGTLTESEFKDFWSAVCGANNLLSQY